MIKKHFSFLFPVLYMIIIFAFSSIPDYGRENTPKIFYLLSPNLQNLLHIPEFGLLAYLWMQALDKNKGSLLKARVWTASISISYGILDELHQLFIPGRYASFGDILFDILGIISGIIIYGLFKSTDHQIN